MDRWQKGVCAAALAAGLLIMLSAGADRALRSDLDTLATQIPDDAYYYLQPAFLFKDHGEFTFDGVNPTYGFQPLWELVLAGLASLHQDKAAFLRSALLTGHVLHTATALVVFLIVATLAGGRRGRATPAWVLLGSALYLLNLPLRGASTVGMENALYGLVLALTLLALAREFVEAGGPRSPWAWLVGAGAGLGLLARLTPASLLVACGLGILMGRRRPRDLARFAGGAAIPLALWLAYAWLAFGALLPMAGHRKLQEFRLAAASGRLLEDAPAMLARSGQYLREILAFSAGAPSRLFHPGDVWLAWALPALALSAGALALVAGLRRGRQGLSQGAGAAAFLLGLALAGSSLAPILLFYMGEGIFYANWYVVEPPLLLAVALPLALPRPGHRTGRFLAVVVSGLLVAGALTARGWLAPFSVSPLDPASWQQSMLRAARHVNHHLPPDARVGAFNAGLLGYFAHRTVINLDGLANNEVLRHSLAGRPLLDYVRSAGITHMVDALPAGGWFGHPLAHYEVLEVLPFTGHHPPGYFIAAVRWAPYPPMLIEPAASGVELMPWRPAGALPPAQKVLRLPASAAPGALHMELDGSYVQMRFRVEWEAGGPAVVMLADGEETLVLSPTTPGHEEGLEPAPLDLTGVARLRITTRPANSVGNAWLTDLRFEPRPPQPAAPGAAP